MCFQLQLVLVYNIKVSTHRILMVLKYRIIIMWLLSICILTSKPLYNYLNITYRYCIMWPAVPS